jgi:hypothetical protein
MSDRSAWERSADAEQRRRWGKARVPGCTCAFNFTCGACLAASQSDHNLEVLPAGKDQGESGGGDPPGDRTDEEQAQHEADDPHCTCNDCMASYANRLED